jgi:hypothetical protein
MIAGDDSWAHYCDPEMRSQSVEYRYPLLPEIKKFRLKLPTESACSRFLGLLRPHYQEHVVKGTIRNSQTYAKTLKKVK